MLPFVHQPIRKHACESFLFRLLDPRNQLIVFLFIFIVDNYRNTNRACGVSTGPKLILIERDLSTITARHPSYYFFIKHLGHPRGPAEIRNALFIIYCELINSFTKVFFIFEWKVKRIFTSFFDLPNTNGSHFFVNLCMKLSSGNIVDKTSQNLSMSTKLII